MQVCQWLLALGLEQHIPKFLEQQVAGSALLQLESRDFKQLGINGDDKNRLKRKLKELKVQVEKEKRQQEKERKEKERLQKKAEKLAEKASKRK
jgi:neurabin